MSNITFLLLNIHLSFLLSFHFVAVKSRRSYSWGCRWRKVVFLIFFAKVFKSSSYFKRLESRAKILFYCMLANLEYPLCTSRGFL
jgi:hypothetical protein